MDSHDYKKDVVIKKSLYCFNLYNLWRLVGTVLVWSQIDPDQNPNWVGINDGQTPAWTDIIDTQSPNWTEILEAA